MKVVLGKGLFMGPISGADETFVTYATQLKLAGHCPSVLLMHGPAPDDPYLARLQNIGVPVSSISTPTVGSSLGLARRLFSSVSQAFPPTKRLLRSRARKVNYGIASRYLKACQEYFEGCGAELIHVVTPDPNAMVMIRAGHNAGVPVLYQELGIPYHPPGFESYYRKFITVLPLCAEVAALSPRLAQHCRKELPQSRTLSVLPIMAEAPPEGYTDPRVTSDTVGFGFAARIEHLKGPLILIEAFAAVRRRMAGVSLNIAGVGTQLKKVARMAGRLGVAGRCHFTGAYHGLEQRVAFMRGLDVFVLPSLTEGTPNSIIEAMSQGLPVIASEVGGVPDVVTPETGILVPPGNTSALADAMLRLAADPGLRKRMGSAARERYEKMFSPEAVLPVMIETYRRVAATQSESVAAHAKSSRKGNSHPWADLTLGGTRQMTDQCLQSHIISAASEP